MLFSSLTFLTLFLPITIVVYFIVPNRVLKNIVLLIASLFFYAWGEPVYVFLMIGLVTLDYLSVLLMDRLQTQQKFLQAKLLFGVTLILNLSGLLFYKYINFILVTINQVFHTALHPLAVVMPIGISFYTFQILSYVIDAYYHRVKVQKKWYLLMTYLSLFPQLIAGPIVRYETVETELEVRHESWDLTYQGLQRFILGLGKKVIIANNVALVASHVYNLPYDEVNFTLAWAGTLAFTLQIYFDFSAYSDMAIGMGKIFGFHFLENFNYPYISTSITDFWRRWHMSLSTWFRDYVYIPMGGNRVSTLRWILNILVVWFLTGLWHGASWTFIVWGLYFALILMLEKWFLLKILKKLPIINILYSLFLIIMGWVIFNSKDLSQIEIFTQAMMDYKQGIDLTSIQYAYVTFTWPYFLLALVGSTPLIKIGLKGLNKYSIGRLLIMIFLSLVLYLSLMYLVNDSYNPFIYFRF